ncbi:MAG: VWA domain-containing protein [Acidobacteriota bacterium]
MKKYAIGLFCIGLFSSLAFAQSNRATRPRVATTPQPSAPTLKNDIPPADTGRRPPVLAGGNVPRISSPSPKATPPVSNDDEEIRIETSLVTMPVSVLDRDGRFVSGLQQKDFQIFENGVQQKVGFFQSVEQPFTVVLMIDVSPSTQYRIDEIQNAAISFVDQLRVNDRVMVVAFDEHVRVLSEPTNDRRELRNAIRQAEFGDGTSLYEAVDDVLNRELKTIQGRKAVVLFTDGVDTTSRRANYQSTISDVEESEALVYTIRYNTQQDMGGWGGGRRRQQGDIDDIIGIILGGGSFPRRGNRGGSSREYEVGRQYLETLATNSGGRKFEADTFVNLENAFSGIAEELRRQYSLGYYPDNVGRPGDRKQIKVRVMRPNLIVKAKSTYIVGQSDKKFAGR